MDSLGCMKAIAPNLLNLNKQNRNIIMRYIAVSHCSNCPFALSNLGCNFPPVCPLLRFEDVISLEAKKSDKGTCKTCANMLDGKCLLDHKDKSYQHNTKSDVEYCDLYAVPFDI
jgi:hypothetical protein